SYHRTLTVNGEIINQGTIQNSRYYLYLHTSGNLTNNGTWTNYRTYLTGTDARTITGNPIAGTIQFNDSLTLSNSLEFPNIVYLNGKTVTFAQGKTATFLNTIYGNGTLEADSLIFKGHVSSSPTLIANDIDFVSTNDTQNISLSSSPLTSNVQFGGAGTKIIGNMTINGSMKVAEGVILQPDYHRTLTVNGDIVNQGTIQNSRYYFYLYTTGHITNHGNWTNYRTYATWNSITNANPYEFNLTDDASQWPDPTSTTDTKYDISDYLHNPELQDSTHYWRVRAQVSGTPTDWSAPKHIIVHYHTAIKVHPTTQAFDVVDIGSQSPAHAFTITNTGNLNLNIEAISLAGTDAAEFNLTTDNCSNQALTPALSCTVEVTFIPSSTGGKIARLLIPSNASETPLEITLTGGGLPGTAVLIEPKETINTATPTFTWSQVDSATHYLVKLTQGSTTLIEQEYSTEQACPNSLCSVILETTLTEGQYQWQVQTANDNGPGFWSTPLSFQVETRPGTLQFSRTVLNITENEPTLTFSVTRDKGYVGSVSVDYSTLEGTATANSDYLPVSGTLNWEHGSTTTQNVIITLQDDHLLEGHETFSVTLNQITGGALLGARDTLTVTLLENDVPPAISIDDLTLTEGDSETQTAQFTISLDTPPYEPVTVEYATSNGSAKAGEDYVALDTTTLDFAPGETSKTVDVVVNADTLDEGESEFFYLILRNPVKATLADNRSLVTITDDDEPPALSIEESNLSVLEGNTGTQTAQLLLNLTTASGTWVRVQYATADDTATAGSDYVAINPKTLTFNPGDTQKTLNVIINGDFLYEENNEQFSLNLSNPVNTTLTQTQAVIVIIDDDINDETGPEVTDFLFEGTPFEQGATLSHSGTLTLTATDGVGVSRVEFWIDGNLFHTDSNGASQYSAFLSPIDVEDGAHTLEIKAYDTLGNASVTPLNINVALAPPSAPVITWPLSGKLTNQAEISVTGAAEKGSEVFIYRNGTLIGEPLTLDKHNTFSGTISLEDGQNNLQAVAQNRGGTGPQSSTIIVTRDTSIPKAPTSLTAQARESGQVRLTWRAPDDQKVIGYDVYRATSAFTTIAAAQKVNAQLLVGTGFDDLVTLDGQYYYRVVAVNAAGTASELSNQVTVLADTTGPRAVIEYSPQGEFDPDSGRIARGLVDITLTVNEPLLTTPFLSLVPDGGLPISIELNPVSETQYQGQFEITENTPEGTAYAVFSARDQASNRGTDIEEGAAIEIDSQGPKVTQLTLLPSEPIRNDANNPVTLQVTLELDETLPAEQIPELSYRLSGSGRQIQALSLTKTGENWTTNFSLPADAGLSETENLQFYFSAEDDLHNRGTEIVGDSQFQIYQGDLPPLTVPFGLKAIALPNGKIQLNWKAVTGASDYQLFRKAPGESQLTPYQRSSGALAFTDNTQQDGLYHYAVASVRQANEQEAFSANSLVVKVTADSLAPQAPTGLQLELIGAGIRATWQAPSGYDKITYQVYREATEIQERNGLTPFKTDINELGFIDGKPDKSQPYYTVIAVDAAGNQSALSETAYLNIDLLPVNTLEVVQDGNNPPVVTWSHPASAELSGFDIYIGPETERVKVNDTLLSETR
ncbi:MAG: hypothetical protein DRR00_29500, partial [Candidatus Parabeggiatoa sp. nov. 3]